MALSSAGLWQMDNIYVAEIQLPSYFYRNHETRWPIVGPQAFGLRRGYCSLRPPSEMSALEGYPDLVLVLEFSAQSLREAEDRALDMSTMFGSLASAYGGHPHEGSRLLRIGVIGGHEGLLAQHDYCYRRKPYMLSEFNRTIEHHFNKYVECFAASDSQTKYQVQSAIHWYGLAVSADDPTVSYVAAWTGLEGIGVILDGKAHPRGTKVACEVCGNEGGKKRDRKNSGIEHMFRRLERGPLSSSLDEETKQQISGDLVEGLSAKEAAGLRHAAVHCLKDVEALRDKCRAARGHVIHVLNMAIQIALGPHVQSWITGDYGTHPDLRISFRFQTELEHSPFFGEWAARILHQTRSAIPADGQIYPTGFAWESAVDSGILAAKCEEMFRRDVDVYSVPDDVALNDLCTWHGRPTDPPWSHII